jgi:predicted enzyme related to lactoylglutathione lyase
MTSTILFAGVPVANHDAAVEWYFRLMGRQPDVIPHATESMWQIATEGWLYVVESPERAGHALITIMVDDVERHVTELTGRGIVAGEVETMAGIAKKSLVTDPDGNRITFAENIAGDGD